MTTLTPRVIDDLSPTRKDRRTMITALATADDGTRIIMLGITHENVLRLLQGRPIQLTAASHPGFPVDLRFLIAYGPNERALMATIQASIGDTTKIVIVPSPGTEPPPS